MKGDYFYIMNEFNAIKILNNHKEFFNTNATKNIDFRIKKLKDLYKAIVKYENEIIDALKKDLGKSNFESYVTEIGLCLNDIRYTIKNIKKWSKIKKVKTPITLFHSKSYIMKEPYGTVLIIGPYNYPFQLVIEPLIGAIAAGNCVCIKPSEVSFNVSKVINKLISETFMEKYISCVLGDAKVTTSLINSRFDYIFFTGSVRVGKIVMEAASKNLIPVTLELGGKSPVIVDESCNIKKAAERIVWGKFLNLGQTCVAPDYVLVNVVIKDKLIKEIIKSIHSFFGDNISENSDYGRIINEKHFDRLMSIINEDKNKIIFGGDNNREDMFISPTIIESNDYNIKAMEDEIFGPILPVIPFNDLDEVINNIKKFEKPLALYLFTNNNKVKEKVLNNISSGGVCINDTISHLVNNKLPFGGVGNSGIGAYHGVYSFNTFTHEKSIVCKSNKIALSIEYPPYSNKKFKLIKKFLK